MALSEADGQTGPGPGPGLGAAVPGQSDAVQTMHLKKRMSVRDSGRLKTSFERVRRAQTRLSSDSILSLCQVDEGPTAERGSVSVSGATSVHDESVQDGDEQDAIVANGVAATLIDWEFWAACLEDYDQVARDRPKALANAIEAGIPTPLRGMIWQLLSQSKNEQLEHVYTQLLTEASTHEKSIRRDLSRTFPHHSHFSTGGLGQESLFNVIKAYSIYDTQVGYCQGLPFIVGPLLLNMPEEDAFCVLVSLMKSYDLRLHFTPDMPSLQLHLFQFDKLLEHFLPRLALHLDKLGVKSSMYASQWFMTLFAYKFPLDLVFRIFDIIFAQGIQAIFKFSIALLRKEERSILTLEFEQVLHYLKTGLFDSYRTNANDTSGPLAAKAHNNETKLGEESHWRTNDFVHDAISIVISSEQLEDFERQYQVQNIQDESIQADCQRLRLVNLDLQSQVSLLNTSLTTLATDHDRLTQELVEVQLERNRLIDENEAFRSQIDELKSILDNQYDQLIETKVKPIEQEKGSLLRQTEAMKKELEASYRDLIEYKVKWAQVNEQVESRRFREQCRSPS